MLVSLIYSTLGTVSYSRSLKSVPLIEGIFNVSSFLVFLILHYQLYIRGSVHRNSRLKKSNDMQQNVDIYHHHHHHHHVPEGLGVFPLP